MGGDTAFGSQLQLYYKVSDSTKRRFIKRKKARSAKGLDISSKSEDPILPCNSSHTYTHTISKPFATSVIEWMG